MAARPTTTLSVRAFARARQAALAALVAAALTNACSSDEPSASAPVDPSDAGQTNDAAQPDTQPDALSDGALVDAGPFPDEDPFAGVWNPVPSTPASCKYLYAANPAALRSKWIACSSGRAGCRKLDTYWTKRPGMLVMSKIGLDPARIADGKAILNVRRFWPGPNPNPFYAYVDVIEPLDGDPMAAIGAAPTWDSKGVGRTCAINAIFGDYGVGFMARPTDLFDAAATVNEVVWGWAPWSSPGTFTTLTTKPADWDGGGSSRFFEATIGSDHVWASSDTPLTPGILTLATKAIRVADQPPNAQGPIAVPDGALVTEISGTSAVRLLKPDGSSARIITATDAPLVSCHTVDRSNANQLVWVESDFGFEATILTSPYATTAGAVVRTKVAKFSDTLQRAGSRGIANAGVFLALVDHNKAIVRRLSDGMGWLIEGEPNERFVEPVWVDDADVLIETAPAPPGTVQYYPSSILRIARANLGAPTIPSGL
jgi:hypothetical protein